MTRPLVVRSGALGDMVLMTVPIRILHERFGQQVDVLGSGAWTRPLLEYQPGVGCIYHISSRRQPYFLAHDQRQLVTALRSRGSGPTWLFDANNEKTRWLLRKAGWHSNDIMELDRLPDIVGEHFCDRWARFALMGQGVPLAGPIKSSRCKPGLLLTGAQRAEELPWLQALDFAAQPYILLQVGNKRTMRRGFRRRPSNTKYWPVTSWAALLRELRARHADLSFVFLGVPAEAGMVDEIIARAGVSNAFNVARQMSVLRLTLLAEMAAGMISVDTGPAHVAAAVGCPLVVLFDSPAKERMYRPRGDGAIRTLIGGSDAHPNIVCLQPEDVIREWQVLLDRGLLRQSRLPRASRLNPHQNRPTAE